MALLLPLALLAVASAGGALGVTAALWRAARLVRDRSRRRATAALRPMILELVAAEEPEPRLAAQLVKLEPKRWSALEPELARLMSKVRGASREVIVEVLVGRGVAERALRQLCSPAAATRARAARTLGLLGRKEAAPLLGERLFDRSALVRRLAAEALGTAGGPSSVPALLTTLSSERPVPAPVVAGAVLAIGPAAVDAVVAALSSPDATVAAVAADLAGRLGAFRAAPVLGELLGEGHPLAVRLAAARSLGLLGLPLAVGVLVEGAREGPRELRLAALRALALIGEQEAAPALGPLVLDADPRVALAAAETLHELGEAGSRELVEARSAGAVAAEAARVLTARRAGPARVTGPLGRAGTNGRLGAAAAGALE